MLSNVCAHPSVTSPPLWSTVSPSPPRPSYALTGQPSSCAVWPRRLIAAASGGGLGRSLGSSWTARSAVSCAMAVGAVRGFTPKGEGWAVPTRSLCRLPPSLASLVRALRGTADGLSMRLGLLVVRTHNQRARLIVPLLGLMIMGGTFLKCHVLSLGEVGGIHEWDYVSDDYE